VGLNSLKSLNLTNGYPNKNKNNKNKNKNNKVKSKPLELRSRVKKIWLLISDTPEYVDSGRRSSLYQLFKKRDFYFIKVAKIGKNGPKMDFFYFFEISHFLKCNRSKTVLMCSTT
jgi:hypothetical protein